MMSSCQFDAFDNLYSNLNKSTLMKEKGFYVVFKFLGGFEGEPTELQEKVLNESPSVHKSQQLAVGART